MHDRIKSKGGRHKGAGRLLKTLDPASRFRLVQMAENVLHSDEGFADEMFAKPLADVYEWGAKTQWITNCSTEKLNQFRIQLSETLATINSELKRRNVNAR